MIFYSFRHRFITTLAQAQIGASGLQEETVLKERIPEALMLRRLAGHSDAHALTADRSNFDVLTDIYTGECSIKSLKKVIYRLHYSNVVLFKYEHAENCKKRRVAMKLPATQASRACNADVR